MKAKKLLLNKSSSPRWRKEQKDRKNKNRRSQLMVGLFFLGFIFSLVVVSFLWGKAKGSVWDGQSVLTMVSQNDDQLELISFFPLQNRWLTLEIPGNTVSLVSSGYGEYQLNSWDNVSSYTFSNNPGPNVE